MIGVMGRAIKLDDNYVQKEIELFSRLSTENQVRYYAYYYGFYIYYITRICCVGIERSVGYCGSQRIADEEFSSWHY